MSSIARATTPEVPEPAAGTWSNCLVADGVAYVAGMTARGAGQSGVAGAFALASYPVFAADMPVDGTKNFTAPGDAPSYFANETVPVSARVANQATFTEDEVTAPEEPATDRGSKRASARKSTKHASG